MATLRLENVRKRYQGAEVLKGIDLSSLDGEFLVLVGPSGCGKSTLLNIIAGLDAPSSGRIFIGEQDVTKLPPRDRNIAMVFQSYALYPTMTVRENIAFALEMRKVPKSEREAAIARVADLLQISHLLDRKPAKLSGGQRQRVAMGRALVRDPAIFLFDEPLSNLDAKLRVEMRLEIKKLHQRLGTTIVYVTHDQIEAMTLASRIAVMKDGVIQQFGTPQDIYDQPANIFVASFIGSPAMNFIPVGIKNNSVFIDHAADQRPEQRKIFALSDETLPRKLEDGRRLTLGIRPEHLELAGEARGLSFEAKVDVIEPTGADTLVGVKLAHSGENADLGLTARLKPQAGLAVGQTLRLTVASDKLTFFDAETQQLISS